MKKNKKIVLSVTAGLTLLVLCFVVSAYYNFKHNLFAFSPQQVSDMQIALKGAMAEAIFEGQRGQAEVVPAAELKGKVGLDALFASTPAGKEGEGLIEAYRRDPEKFKRYAEMFDTAMNAKQVGDAVLKQNISHLPATSESLQMEPKLKVDAWGNPFCIISATSRVAIVSGGPSHLSCDNLPVTKEQIAQSHRSLYAGTSDVVIVIARR